MTKKAKRKEAQRAARAIAQCMRAAEVRPVPNLVDWAVAERVLPGEVSARPGPFGYDLTPWMREPSMDVDDPTVSELVLCLAARLGKTELLMNLTGRTIHADPRNQLKVYPD
jgi:phage terminase large subunit GpA-like protein